MDAAVHDEYSDSEDEQGAADQQMQDLDFNDFETGFGLDDDEDELMLEQLTNTPSLGLSKAAAPRMPNIDDMRLERAHAVIVLQTRNACLYA